jgi:uncharacterized protein (TIGR02147 family)
MQSIFHYLDYREYLLAYFEYRKAATPWYSLKVMGDAIQLDQSQVYRIIQRQLHFSKAALPRMLEYLALSSNESHYFLKMVEFAKSKKEPETRKLFKELLELRGTNTQTLENDQLQLYSEWYYPIIRAILGCITWKEDYEELAQKVSPPITISQAKRAITVLENIGLIRRNHQGEFVLTQNSVTTGSKFHSLAVKQYQAHTFRLAEASLDRHNKEDRDFNVINMALDHSAFEDCKAILTEARRQIRERIEKVENPDRVLRLASALFPVALLEPPKKS